MHAGEIPVGVQRGMGHAGQEWKQSSEQAGSPQASSGWGLGLERAVEEVRQDQVQAVF